ncbi:hypothetical protein G7Y89_g8068 [Cudoniella acicularis]|uniref:Xylanolytic transcriptional activator regulatory domain-containing protein n=1 Tax=Cudoniella acicularis TaxID=354080 RepID=A0A8H4W3Y2_9HELO|nr:hypothetical protein G7Y89_g8068 [Cudoniella acicularis]
MSTADSVDKAPRQQLFMELSRHIVIVMEEKLCGRGRDVIELPLQDGSQQIRGFEIDINNQNQSENEDEDEISVGKAQAESREEHANTTLLLSLSKSKVFLPPLYFTSHLISPLSSLVLESEYLLDFLQSQTQMQPERAMSQLFYSGRSQCLSLCSVSKLQDSDLWDPLTSQGQSQLPASSAATPLPAKTLKATNGTDNHHLTEIQHGVGVLQMTESHSQYRGSTHWGDVFQELNELKIIWTQMQEERDDTDASLSFPGIVDGPTIFSGPIKPITFQELLETIPAKPTLDKILERFFDLTDSPVPSFNIIHQPTFMKRYEEHWAHPAQTKVMWLGLLFSILSLIMLSYHLLENEPPEFEGVSGSLFKLYRLRTTQCLVMGDITKCAPHTLETLIFHAMVEQARRSDGAASAWMVFGVMNRVALQMGYHRYFVVRLDALLSFQMGLPGITRSICYDTQLPRNLHDWEMHEGLTELPPSRPKSEITPVSYMIAKESILLVLGNIVDLLSELIPYSYDRVLKLDDELARAQAEIPPYFQMRSLEDSTNDPSSLVSRRVQLEILYHQGVCVLHRKFLAQGRLDGRFEPSRNRCIQSAMALLSLQNFLYHQAQNTPGSETRGTRHWYRFSFTDREFILATMILCLDLRHRKVSRAAKAEYVHRTDNDQEEPIIAALQTAHQIWDGSQKACLEARKAFRIISHMLDLLGVLPKADAPPNRAAPQEGQQFAEESNSQFIDLEPDMNVDWAVWNSFVEGTSFEDAYNPNPPATAFTTNMGFHQFDLN